MPELLTDKINRMKKEDIIFENAGLEGMLKNMGCYEVVLKCMDRYAQSKGQTLPLDSVRLRYFKAKYYARHLERDVVIVIKGRDYVEAKCEYLMRADVDELTFVSEITE